MQPLMQPEYSPTTLLAGISAVMQAIQTWLAIRNARKSAKAFRDAYQEARDSIIVAQETEVIKSLVPHHVLRAMTDRTTRCWENYSEIIESEGKYLPQEIDEATEAVKRCICRELKRIRNLNQAIPPGILTNWWENFCHEKRK